MICASDGVVHAYLSLNQSAPSLTKPLGQCQVPASASLNGSTRSDCYRLRADRAEAELSGGGGGGEELECASLCEGGGGDGGAGDAPKKLGSWDTHAHTAVLLTRAHSSQTRRERHHTRVVSAFLLMSRRRRRGAAHAVVRQTAGGVVKCTPTHQSNEVGAVFLGVPVLIARTRILPTAATAAPQKNTNKSAAPQPRRAHKNNTCPRRPKQLIQLVSNNQSDAPVPQKRS